MPRRRTVVLLSVAAAVMLPSMGSPARGAGSAPVGNVIRVRLLPANGFHVSGTATLTHLGTRTRVVIALTKSMPGRLPAHIHIGPCKLDPNLNLKAGLNDVVNGRSTTILDPFPTWAELLKGALSIHVHNPRTLATVTCGNFPNPR
jgi:hypothetical protein